jgi:hypothetical protein
MNYPDKQDIEEIKRTGHTTDRERMLLEALSEAERTSDRIGSLFTDYPVTKDIRPDLERIRDTLKELKDLAEKEAEAWFTDTNTPAPVLTSDNPLERFAAMSLKFSDLFNDSIADFEDLEALGIAVEVYEIAEKAWKEI